MSFISNKIRAEFLGACASASIGSLSLRTPDGDTHHFGTGQPEAHLDIRDWGAVTAAAARGDIGFGEAYVAGLWESDDLESLMQFAILNMEIFETFAVPNFWSGLKFRIADRILRANSKRGASRNIKSHYDVGNEFYQLWLDPGMTYSSGLFTADDRDLNRAQDRKYDRILQGLGDGARVLEIGCGWGGFAERAAESGRDVTGVTISPSQKGYADARLDGRARIDLMDYRDIVGRFDNIVSIEMIEAVGERYWPVYFEALKNRLADHGRAMIQAITVPDSYFATYRKNSDFIRQYTFPGGMLLSEKVIREQASKAGLAVQDVFGFGRDYGLTCRIWNKRLWAEERRIRNLGYDSKFLRSWQFYLESCAAAFETGQTDVLQVRLAHA